MTLPLFEIEPPPVSARQRVNQLRDEAMRRVAENAEARRAQFAEDARAFVLKYLREHGATAGEQITLACKDAGIVPHDDRAFGPVYFGLRRRGLITIVGECRRERGHGTRGGNVWALVEG